MSRTVSKNVKDNVKGNVKNGVKKKVKVKDKRKERIKEKKKEIYIKELSSYEDNQEKTARSVERHKIKYGKFKVCMNGKEYN